MELQLYSYFRSSAAYRVRIALNLKGLDWQSRGVHLTRGGGEQKAAAYREINPQGLVPALALDARIVTQSQAICELLEELHPTPPLLPAEPFARAYVREVMALVACDIHPLNNLRAKEYLNQMGIGSEAWMGWYRHWIAVGLTGLEALVTGSGRAGRFCLGDSPTLADAFLVPQIYNALRFDCPTAGFPALMRIHETCTALPAFAEAAPEVQPDAE
ncbi:maleylacetoacetate isomerase [Frigidibacter sp. ROC022]|uniref:maleylacetoacetate isomerase n=1 Tax=Frigidibacter sp. ROC022 TaxID=2971796 RepID=UPI00215AA3CA|nr:maleylacetoacetate isomerase [Frigidibacter sp. ROC022]MCR8722845.1 maleylacetoacetate isomerase [Frigidibacter sp. ROC022]